MKKQSRQLIKSINNEAKYFRYVMWRQDLFGENWCLEKSSNWKKGQHDKLIRSCVPNVQFEKLNWQKA